MVSSPITLSIIIPAYNEEYRIAPTLKSYLSFFGEIAEFNTEIIVVLNGCRDNTKNIAEGFLVAFPLLKIVNIEEAIGKGGAVKKGFEIASGKYIGYTDADNSTSPIEFQKIFNTLLENSSISCGIGSRNMPDSKVSDKHWKRNIMSAGFNLGVNTLFGLHIEDTQCGAKIFKREIVEKIIPDLTIANMAFDINLLVDTKRKGGLIKEVGIQWDDKDGSTITSPVGTSVAMALSVLRLRIIYSPLCFLYPILEPIGRLLLTMLGQKRFKRI